MAMSDVSILFRTPPNFLTPIEFEHAILASQEGLKSSVFKFLEADGYPREEIERIASVCINLKYVHRYAYDYDEKLTISLDRRNIARRLFILDLAANNASTISEEQRKSMKYILVPGYGKNYGILESDLTAIVCSTCKQIKIDASTFISDIEWLLDEGVIKRH